MFRNQKGFHDLVVTTLRGGRNGFDPPHALPEGQAAELLNLDMNGGATLPKKRNGASTDTMTFSSGGPFTGTISFLGRHVPSSDETAAELWAIDDAATPIVGRKAASTQYAAVTLKDAITGNPWDVTSASINSKFFLSYKSAQDRLPVWDSVAGSVRRAGFATPAAPTAANTGAGTYAAVLRYYRVRWTEQQGGVTVRRSEAGASVSFTPSGGGTAARVTQPTVASEGETHWEVEASTDNASFYVIATVVIGTTTYDDSAATSSYASGTASASAGTYTAPKSYKFIAVDQNRLLGFGAYTSTNKQNTIEFSAVVGSLNVGDAERIPSGNTITLDENDSGVATGLVGPMNMAYYAFKYRQVWRLTPTGDATTPYLARAISKVVGALSHHCIKVAEDESGYPAIYWLSHRGPYRYGRNGLEDLTDKGGSVRDLIQGPTKTINLAPTKAVAHTVYHADIRQVWFWYATGNSNDPDQRIVWDVRAGAWVRHDGEQTKARCSAMFSNTQGATMSRDLKPYIGYTGATNKVWKCDDSAATDDAGTAFQAYMDTRAYAPWGFGKNGSVDQVALLAKAQSGVTIQQTMTADFGAQPTNTSSVTLTATGAETRVVKNFEASQMQGAAFVQFRWGDSAAVSNAWQLDTARVLWKGQEPL